MLCFICEYSKADKAHLCMSYRESGLCNMNKGCV